MKRKPDLQYVVHWIIVIAIFLGVAGSIVQFFRYGDIIQPGGTGTSE